MSKSEEKAFKHVEGETVHRAKERAWGRRLSTHGKPLKPEHQHEYEIDLRTEIQAGFRMGVEWEQSRRLSLQDELERLREQLSEVSDALDMVIEERDDLFDDAVWTINDGKDTSSFFGYHPSWIHADFCPKGIRPISYDGDKWASCKWNGTHDEWIKVVDAQPTHLAKSFPVSPPRQALQDKGDQDG